MTKTRSWTKGPGLLGAALLRAVGVLGAVLAAGPAGTTLPGANGKIAYANGGIWVAGPGGENPTRLTSSFMDADPSWSPDGKRIAFTRFNGCQNPECVFGDVWVMDADGTDGSLVTKGFNPSWSPDGERLAYESCATSGSYPCDGDKRNVSLVNPDGTGRVDLTSGMRAACNNNTTSREVEPAWSPDGTRIAFASSAERCRMEIYAMDADGTGKVRLSKAGINEADGQPSWSPDGQEIVFSRSYEAEMPRVYSVDADGVLGEVAFPNARGFEPAWAPDRLPRHPRQRGHLGDRYRRGHPAWDDRRRPGLADRPDHQAHRKLTQAGPRIQGPRHDPPPERRGDGQRDGPANVVRRALRGRALQGLLLLPGHGQLTHKSAKLTPGSHTVKVVAKDDGGLKTTKSWNFKVVR